MSRPSTMVLAFLALACGTGEPSRTLPETGAPRAPIVIEAKVGERSAHVKVRFDADVTDGHLDVRGVDGLVVTSRSRPVERASLQRGHVEAFTVDYTPGPGESALVIEAYALFGPQRAKMGTTAMFLVGTESAEQKAKRAKAKEAVKVNSSGELIHEMRVPREP